MDEMAIITKAISELLNKAAIQAVSPIHGQFISNIFIVPNKNGTFRPVINLRGLNAFVEYMHFKQENLRVILDLIQRNDYLTSMDVQDAYFSIPIHPEYHKYLRFSWSTLSVLVLPFGLSSAPHVFAKVLKPVYAKFRKAGITCSYYIDDSLQMNQNYDTLGSWLIN